MQYYKKNILSKAILYFRQLCRFALSRTFKHLGNYYLFRSYLFVFISSRNCENEVPVISFSFICLFSSIRTCNRLTRKVYSIFMIIWNQMHLTWLINSRRFYFCCDNWYIWVVTCVVQWLLSSEMDTVNRVQVLNVIVCISYDANTLGKGRNPFILPSAMNKE